jgi:hypothetical protein
MTDEPRRCVFCSELLSESNPEAFLLEQTLTNVAKNLTTRLVGGICTTCGDAMVRIGEPIMEERLGTPVSLMQAVYDLILKPAVGQPLVEEPKPEASPAAPFDWRVHWAGGVTVQHLFYVSSTRSICGMHRGFLKHPERTHLPKCMRCGGIAVRGKYEFVEGQGT